MKRVPPANLAIFFLLAGGGAALDLFTKWLAFTKNGSPPHSRPLVLWHGVFSFTTSFNKGALWGLGGSFPQANVGFASLSVLAGAAILYWLFWHGAAKDRILSAALGLIMAGTIGNCYDRIVWGQVRDFIYFELINWPIFNLADSFLVCGAAALMVQALFAEMPNRQPTAAVSHATHPAAEVANEG